MLRIPAAGSGSALRNAADRGGTVAGCQWMRAPAWRGNADARGF